MAAAAGGLGACSYTVSRLALVCAILLAVLSPLLMLCFCVLQRFKKFYIFFICGVGPMACMCALEDHLQALVLSECVGPSSGFRPSGRCLCLLSPCKDSPIIYHNSVLKQDLPNFFFLGKSDTFRIKTESNAF